METVIILAHKAQNPLTATYFHTMATVLTTHIFINIITNQPTKQPTLLIIWINANKILLR
jgi:hypothetical protein